MRPWQSLNDLRTSVYCGDGAVPANTLENLVAMAAESNDVGFIRSVLQIREDIEIPNAKRKLLWLTSKIGDRTYPPLAVDLAGPIQTNNNILLKSDSPSIRAKYCLNKTLDTDNEILDGIEQCKEIEDCSLVASLIIIKNGQVTLPPIKNVGPHKYHVNLHFNGSRDRLVTVDTSSIPTDLEGNQLALKSPLLEDKIIELAWLQVLYGSYDSKGSNCAIATFLLTGFAPEIVDIKEYSIKKLVKFFYSGLCLMAMGTGDESAKLEGRFIKNHDYPILSVNEASDTLILGDTRDSTRRTVVDDESLNKYFKQVYLIWKTPKLFSVTNTLHFNYNALKFNQFRSVFDKPKFSLRNKSDTSESVWLLLETNLRTNFGNDRVAYLKQLPNNLFLNSRTSPEGACDIGLQLIKLMLPSKSNMHFFCHSSEDAHLTIHSLSNSSMITLSRANAGTPFASSVYSAISESNYTFGSPDYFRNPTFSLEVSSPTSREVSVHIQLLSDDPRDLINVQLFHLEDHALSKPLLCDSDYNYQKYEKLYIPLITNSKYKIICSSYTSPLSREFKLVVAPSEPKIAEHLKLKLQKVYLEHGGYNHKIEKKFRWAENSNRIKIKLKLVANTMCFIRIVPDAQFSKLLVRCNIFDHDTQQNILQRKIFQRPTCGGIVLDKIELYGSTSVTLLIEKDDARSANIPSKAISFSLILGSQTKITIDE